MKSGQKFDAPSYFTVAQADKDAALAAVKAAHALNQTPGSAIYFAVDDEDANSYFRGHFSH